MALSAQKKLQRQMHATKLYRTAANKAAERIAKAITVKQEAITSMRSAVVGVEMNHYAIRRALEDFGLTVAALSIDPKEIRAGLDILDAPKPKATPAAAPSEEVVA